MSASECSMGLPGLPWTILSSRFTEARLPGVGIAEPDTDRGATPIEAFEGRRSLIAMTESDVLRSVGRMTGDELVFILSRVGTGGC